MTPEMIAAYGALTVAVLGSFVLPIVKSSMDNRVRAVELRTKEARDDLLADRVNEVRKQAERAADLLKASTAAQASAAKSTNDKLDVIHTLVNSNMTAALQAELDATISQLAMMQEMMALKQASGHEPLPDVLAAVERTKARIAELRSTLADRLKAANVVQEQVQAQAAKPV